MPAAKSFDPVMGVDVHLIQPPGPVPPLPIPHPFIGMLIDPMDFVPILGATVMVNGMPRAQAGSSGKGLPPHIPIGGTFVKPPSNECEMFMGSATVEADGDAFSYMALPALSCQCVGMPAPFRKNPKKKTKAKSLVLPTSVVLPIPAGLPVVVGGPPTISISGMAQKLGMAGLGAAFKKFSKSGLAKRMKASFQKAKKNAFKNMKPGFLKCTVLKAEPVDITTGEVVVQQEDFALDWPLEWTRAYRSRDTYAGEFGRGWQTPADIRLELQASGEIVFRHALDGDTWFDAVPADGDTLIDPADGAVLARHGERLTVRVKPGLTHHFALPRAEHPVAMVERIHDDVLREVRFVREEAGQGQPGRLVEIVSNCGPRVVVTREGPGRAALSLVHPAAPDPIALVTYELDGAGELVAVLDADDKAYRFAYENRRMVRHTTRGGLNWRYEYDGPTQNARVIHAWGDGGLYDYRFGYRAGGSQVLVTDSLGHHSTFDLDHRQLPVRETDPLGGVTIYEYDELGRTLAVVDPDQRRTGYVYDDRGNVAQVIRPDGAAVLAEFNADGLPTRLVDAAGRATTLTYSATGLLTRQVSPLGATTEYAYDAFGNLTALTDPNGRVTRMAYDQFGNPVRIIDPEQNAQHLTFDALGNLVQRQDALGGVARYSYDVKGRLTRAVSPAGRVTAFAHDVDDNVASMTDGLGAVTRMEYFGQGLLAARHQPDNHSVRFKYDTEERLIGVVNQRGQTYHLVRDALGRVVKEVDYWGRARSYTYSGAGLLRDSVDPLGRVVKYKLDPLGRLLARALPDGTSEQFAYDPAGNLAAAESPAGKVETIYDAHDRPVLQKQSAAGFEIAWQYDLADNLVQRRTKLGAGDDAPGNTVAYRYDGSDRCVGVVINGEAEIAISRDALGRATREQAGPGGALRREFGYDADSMVTSAATFGAEGPVFRREYAYDANGELTRRADSRRGVDAYFYDPMGRIREHIDPEGRVRAFLHDPAGDLLRDEAAGGGSEALLPPAQAGPTPGYTRTASSDRVTAVFDAAGNMTRRTVRGKTIELRWDALNRLTTSINPEGTATKYAYDAMGRRLSKQTSDRVTRFAWDGERLAGDITPRGLREFVYHPGTFEPLAMIEPAAGGAGAAGRVLHYHNDPNGSPQDVTDARGVVLWSAHYSALGGVDRVYTEEIDQPLRLQGQYADAETGLCYNRFRYFDPETGSFVSQDPIGLAGGEGVYAAFPNANGWTDPLGLTCSWDTARKNYWKNAYKQQMKKSPSKRRYSPTNLARMKEGKAPRMRAKVQSRTTGKVSTKNVSLELHHKDVPQRVGGAGVHDADNLRVVTPWQHEAADPYRHTGSDLLQTVQGPGTYTGS